MKITRDEIFELEGGFQICLLISLLLNPPEDKQAGFLSSDFSHPSLAEFERKSLELPSGFRDQKQRVLCVRVILQKYSQYYDEGLVRTVILGGTLDKLRGRQSNTWRSYLSALLPANNATPDIDIKKDVNQHCSQISDQEFLANLDRYVMDEPLVEAATRRALDVTYDHLSVVLSKAFASLMPLALKKHQDSTKAQLIQELDNVKKDALDRSTETFIKEINSVSDNNTSTCVILRSPLRSLVK